jgi:hypothetical protein
MAEALLARGFAADDILCLHGRLDRLLVLAAWPALRSAQGSASLYRKAIPAVARFVVE